MPSENVKNIQGNLNVEGIITCHGMPMPTVESVDEYASKDIFPIPGSAGIIYVDKTENRMYRWDATLEEYCLLNDYAYRADEESTSITYTFEDMADKTYTQLVNAVNLTIPASASQGFEAGIVFKTGSAIPSFTLTNLSETPVKMIQFGTTITSYVPATHSTITILVYNDKLYNNVLIYEVAD